MRGGRLTIDLAQRNNSIAARTKQVIRMRRKIDDRNIIVDVGVVDEANENITINNALWYAQDKYAHFNKYIIVHAFYAKRSGKSDILAKRVNSTFFIFFRKNKYVELIRRLIKYRRKILLVQINTFPKPWLELPIVLISKLLGLKVVDFVHNVYDFKIILKSKILRLIAEVYYRYLYFSLVDAVFFCTNYQRKLYTFVRKPTFVFPFGVDINVFKPSDKKISHDKLKILYAGVIAPHKKIHEIVEALADGNLKNRVFFMFTGKIFDIRYFHYLTNFLEKGNIEYAYYGYVSIKRLIELYNEADVFINLRPDEAFGKVFIEAMACGTPVIGRVGAPGTEEVIINGKNGFKVKDTSELRRILIYLLNNQEKMSILSKFAHEFVIKHYTYEHSYMSLKRAYDSLFIKA